MIEINKLLRLKIVKNWSSLVFSMVITSMSSFFCFLVLGKKMSVEDYGLFNSLLALASSVAVFVNNILAGIIANREIALNKNISRSILIKFLPIRIIAFVFGALFILLYVKDKENVSVLIFISVVLMLSFDSFWDLFEQIAFGLKVTTYSMLINIISSIVWLIMIILIPLELSTISIVIFVYSIICVSKVLIYGYLDFKLTKTLNKKDDFGYKYYFLSSVPYLYNRVLGIISTQIPILLLDGYSGLSETAYYAVGEKFTTPIIKLVTVTISAVFPFLTKALKKNRSATKKLVINTFQLLITLGGFCALLLSMTTDIWLIGILGEKYKDAIEAFNYQIWFAIIICVDSFLSMLLSSDFKQKILAKITTIDAVLLLPFLYFGMGFGAKGLAFAKLIHAAICLLYHLIIIGKDYSVSDNNEAIIRLIMAWTLFSILVNCSIVITKKSHLVFVWLVYTIIMCIYNKRAMFEAITFLKDSIRRKSEIEL